MRKRERERSLLNFFILGKVFFVKQLTFGEIYCKIDLIEKIISRIFTNPLK